MRRIQLLSIVLLLAVLGSGCTAMAPNYSASIENVQKLKDAGNFTAKLGAFTSKEDPANPKIISIRASSMVSPYKESYAEYLAEAIKSELTVAGKLSPNADIEISGVLLKNDLNTSSFSVAFGDIQARFVIKRGGQVKYDRVKSAHKEWESSFAGAVAIPRARQEYPHLVQALLAELYTDKDFVQAVK